LCRKNPKKVNLGVGIYYDDTGKVPVLECVRRAERDMAEKSAPRAYSARSTGLAAYRQRPSRTLVFGGRQSRAEGQSRHHRADPGWHRRLKVGADFLRGRHPTRRYGSVTRAGKTTAQSLRTLVSQSNTYPYYDAPTHGVKFSAMLDCSMACRPAIVLLHACCHNPTGVDLTPDQWAR